jgi:hypothetical protein
LVTEFRLSWWNQPITTHLLLRRDDDYNTWNTTYSTRIRYYQQVISLIVFKLYTVMLSISKWEQQSYLVSRKQRSTWKSSTVFFQMKMMPSLILQPRPLSSHSSCFWPMITFANLQSLVVVFTLRCFASHCLALIVEKYADHTMSCTKYSVEDNTQ